MDPRLLQLRKDNRALCESRTRLPVSETVSVPAAALERVEDEPVAEGAGGHMMPGMPPKDMPKGKMKRNPRFKMGKVGHADKNNENDRVYPRKEWLANIERVNAETGPQGIFIGAVDHLGCAEGGNLKASPILWRSLQIDEGGGVYGEFEVVKDHSAGKDLLAQIDAGMTVGFSTFGYATAHRPSKEEAELYGLPYDDDVEDDEYDGPVIIDNWELVKIDAVDNPAVRDARLVRDSRGGGTIHLNNTGMGGAPTEDSQMDIKTLADLQTHLPDVFALHQAELDKLQAEIDAHAADDAKYRAIVKKLGESLTCLAKEHGAEIPLREGAEVNAGLEKRIGELTTIVADNEKELEKVESERAELQQKLDALEAEKADLKRRADVTAKAGELLKDHKFEAAIRKAVEKRIRDAAFDVAAVEALVREKAEEYKLVAPKVAPAPAAAPAEDDADDDREQVDDRIKGLTVLQDSEDDLVDEDGLEVERAKPLSCLAD